MEDRESVMFGIGTQEARASLAGLVVNPVGNHKSEYVAIKGDEPRRVLAAESKMLQASRQLRCIATCARFAACFCDAKDNLVTVGIRAPQSPRCEQRRPPPLPPHF